jgi:hypothetical protein
MPLSPPKRVAFDTRLIERSDFIRLINLHLIIDKQYKQKCMAIRPLNH